MKRLLSLVQTLILMRKLAILAIFLALTVLVSGCTQSTTPVAATTVATPAPTIAPTIAPTQPAIQGDAAQYQATSEKINAEIIQVGLYLNNVISKLSANTAPADLPNVLTSVSNDLQDAKFHVQTAQELTHTLSGYASTPQQQQESQKFLTDLLYFENALTALNTYVEEAQKTSPNITLMDAKLKETSDWLAKVK